MGHLCIRVENGNVFPHPQEMEFAELISRTELEHLETKIAKGALLLPKELISTPADEEIPLTPICRVGNNYYLQRHWVFEIHFLKQLQRVKHAPSLFASDLGEIRFGDRLLPEQASAILKASQNTVSIINGGPGTGKTYTIMQLIKVFLSSLNPEKRGFFEIAIAAPTGKAASHLNLSLKKHAIDFENVACQTLHALLGIREGQSFKIGDINQISADLVIIDECAMIDIYLMHRLLAAVKEGAHVVLVGDPHQLPPIESGAIFSDLVRSDILPITHLKTCMRTELKEIVAFSNAVQVGDADQALKILEKDTEVVSCWTKSVEELIQYAEEKYVCSYNEACPEEILELFNQFRVLTPMRKGPFGVEEMNRVILNHIMKRVPLGQKMVVPIIILKNDYRNELFNGEVGILVEGEHAIFFRKDSTVRKIPAVLLPKYEYSYCISVHKSQGSEFDEVLVLVPEGSEKFGRELLYSAVTRARKKIILYGNEDTIRKNIERQNSRLSGMSRRGYL
jgi:exodeoxyribonuclease V alpha subunit